jgi:hypothetical protein
MAEVSVGTAVTIIMSGPAVYEFLKKINDKTVMVKCQFPTDKNDNKIIFTAYDHHSLVEKLFTSDVPPWGVNHNTHCWSYHGTRRKKPTKFKIIEVICENKEEFRHFLNKYQGNSAIKQHDVIEYLTYISSRFDNINVSMASTRIAVERRDAVSGDLRSPIWITWEEWKLTLTIR